MLCTYSKFYFRDILINGGEHGRGGRGGEGWGGSSGRPGASWGISDGWAARKEERQRPEVGRLSLAVNSTEIKAYLCRITVPN